MHRIWAVVALFALACATPAEVHGQIMVVGNSVQERVAQPGELYSGAIRIRNQSSEPRAVRVYQTDYLFQADGTSSYAEPGSHARSNAGWMAVAPTDLLVPGLEEVEITYRITVPTDVTPAGTYWSMVMVEPAELPSEDPADPGEPSIGLRTTVRFGIQIATHVAGEAEHRLRVGNPQVVLDETGKRHLQFELVNTGDVGYRPTVSLEMFAESGARLTTLEAQRGLIYPGTSALQQFELSDLPPGSYQAVVVVDTGSLEVFGAQFNLTIGARN